MVRKVVELRRSRTRQRRKNSRSWNSWLWSVRLRKKLNLQKCSRPKRNRNSAKRRNLPVCWKRRRNSLLETSE